MEKENHILNKNNLLSTNILKMVAIFLIIINHTIIYTFPVEKISGINGKYFCYFWLYQAVSLCIVITGIHYTKSMEYLLSKDLEQLGVMSWYKKSIFIKKFMRLWLPYTIEQITWLSYCYIRKLPYLGKENFFQYARGGIGPGGYYTICMIQSLVIFPVLYVLVKKYKVAGVLVIVGVNLIYEILVKQEMISASFYRLCCIRLITGLMIGIVICLYYNKIKGTVIPWIMFLFGFGVLAWYLWGGY